MKRGFQYIVSIYCNGRKNGSLKYMLIYECNLTEFIE
jgi:hypothetical protein